MPAASLLTPFPIPAVDSDGSNFISMAEICKAAFHRASAKERKLILSFVFYTGEELGEDSSLLNKAHVFSKHVQEEVRRLFTLYDLDGDGELSVRELETALLEIAGIRSASGLEAAGQRGQQVLADIREVSSAPLDTYPFTRYRTQHPPPSFQVIAGLEKTSTGAIGWSGFLNLMGPAFEKNEQQGAEA
jgi:hypothetical protein